MSGNPKNFGVTIKSHEKTQSHLDASIAFGRWKAGQRMIVRAQEHAIATEATFWRKCLLRKINIIIPLAMMSLASRTHGRWQLPWWQLPRARGDASAVRPGRVGSTSYPGSNNEVSERKYPKRTDVLILGDTHPSRESLWSDTRPANQVRRRR